MSIWDIDFALMDIFKPVKILLWPIELSCIWISIRLHHIQGYVDWKWHCCRNMNLWGLPFLSSQGRLICTKDISKVLTSIMLKELIYLANILACIHSGHICIKCLIEKVFEKLIRFQKILISSKSVYFLIKVRYSSCAIVFTCYESIINIVLNL